MGRLNLRFEDVTATERVPPRPLPKSNGGKPAEGLAYERKVAGTLAQAFAPLGFDLSHNPWIAYESQFARGVCVPDILIAPQSGEFADDIFVVEVKLTWVPEAIEKLRGLYCPIVRHMFGKRALPVVVCKHLAPGAPAAKPTFLGAATSEDPVLHWLGHTGLRLGSPVIIVQ